jgi:hypothetical protein
MKREKWIRMIHIQYPSGLKVSTTQGKGLQKINVKARCHRLTLPPRSLQKPFNINDPHHGRQVAWRTPAGISTAKGKYLHLNHNHIEQAD